MRKLRIEDQLQLKSLAFTSDSDKLEELLIHNCKAFSKLTGLNKLTSLKQLVLSCTAVDFDNLLADGVPEGLKNLTVATGRKADREIAHRIAEMGYKEAKFVA